MFSRAGNMRGVAPKAVLTMALVLLAGCAGGSDAAPRKRSSRGVKLVRKIIMDYLVDNDQTCVITPGVKFFDTPIGIAYADAAKFVLAEMPDASLITVDRVRTSCNILADRDKRLRVVITTAPVEMPPIKNLITNLRNGYYAQVAKQAHSKLGAANSAWWPCTIKYLSKFNSVCRAKTSCVYRNSQRQQLTSADLPALLTYGGYCISQSDTLLDLKVTLNGHGVTNNWSPDTPVCSWLGITCNAGGDVIKVDLGGSLVGSIPPGGFTLPFTVTDINLSGNPSSGMFLVGPFPQDFILPPSLERVTFADNQITGGLVNLGNGMPPTIQEINLSNNQIGISSSELTFSNLKGISPFLQNVQTFDISGNPGMTPDANVGNNIDFSSMITLVDWSYDNHGDLLPPLVKRLLRARAMNPNDFPYNLDSKISSVSLNGIGMTGEFKGVTLPTTLTSLDVSDNSLSGVFSVIVPEGAQLKFIKAANNQIMSLSVVLPKTCQPSFKMDFSNNAITELPKQWDATLCSNLEKIDMRGNPLQCPLQSWPKLTSTQVIVSKAAADKMCAADGKVPTAPIYVVEGDPNYQWRSCSTEPTGPCTPNPCKNGGTCMVFTPTQFYCTCIDNWTGDTCEI